jgi:hypothetical protein
MFTVMWRIESLRLLWPVSGNILPEAEFTLYQSKHKKKVSGWLPVHHSDVEYDLVFNNQSKIVQINNIRRTTRKKRLLSGYTSVQKAAAHFFKNKPSDNQLRKGTTRRQREDYLALAKQALTDLPLWCVSVIYPHSRVRTSNYTELFSLLTENIENICKKDSKAAITRLLYNKELAKNYIDRVLVQMGELPYTDWEGFEQRMAWQLYMRYHTASYEHPGRHVPNIEKYKNVWTTREEIETCRRMKLHLRKDNVNLIIGCPCPSNMNSSTVVVARSLEDVYRLKCFVIPAKICMLNCPWNNDHLKKLGISDLTLLEEGQHVHVAYAHYWGIGDWLALFEKKPTHYTCVGRLDQYSSGRGQIFRDMHDSAQFNISYAHHRGTENVITMPRQEDLAAFTHGLRQQWGVVQCFGYEMGVDTGRRIFKRPFRIRTLKLEDSDRLYEEKMAHFPGKNASMTSVANYRSLHVPAVVIFCNGNTSAFDVHVARTWATCALYIVEQHSPAPCMFSFKRLCPKRRTINPFT